MLFDQLLEHLVDDIRFVGAAIDLSNDQIIVMILLSQQPLVFLLLSLDLLKLLYNGHGQIDRADTALGFGGFQHQSMQLIMYSAKEVAICLGSAFGFV